MSNIDIKLMIIPAFILLLILTLINPIIAFLIVVILLILAIFLLFIIILALFPIFRQSDMRNIFTHTNSTKCNYSKINFKDIVLSYNFRDNGGGLFFAHEFVRIVSKKFGKVDHAFEYCAGSGFIGFNLLANNLCNRLTLSDVNPQAIDSIKETIKSNNLENKVTVYQSDCLYDIPESEKWDLVIGNPPWDITAEERSDNLLSDPHGRVHKAFYNDINKYLNPDGSIIFIEGHQFTTEDSFKNMTTRNGLKIVESFNNVPFLKIFSHLKEYPGLKTPLIIFVRLCLSFHENYFVWVKKDESSLNS